MSNEKLATLTATLAIALKKISCEGNLAAEIAVDALANTCVPALQELAS